MKFYELNFKCVSLKKSSDENFNTFEIIKTTKIHLLTLIGRDGESLFVYIQVTTHLKKMIAIIILIIIGFKQFQG
jgi:hypothetical protein